MEEILYGNNSCKLYKGDCLEVMDNLIKQGVKVDCVITDPPYKIVGGGMKSSLCTGGIFNKNKKTSQKGTLFKHNNINFIDWLDKVFTILKDNSHIYVYSNDKNLKNIISTMEKVGFKLHNILIWVKNNVTPNHFYMKKTEFIIFGRKGRAFPIKNQGDNNVFIENNITNKLHPTQKPIKQIETMILNSSNSNFTILDPFMGSSSTGIACLNTGRNFIGIELDDNYFDISVNRIKDHIPNNESNIKKDEYNIDIIDLL
jgi:site-specific DNA-methyltransferase (adenine-specific)